MTTKGGRVVVAVVVFIVVAVVFMTMTMTAGGQAKAQETKLPAGEVVYRTESVTLAQALAEVALVLGIELRQVALPAATLSGRFREPSGQALLDRLASAHDFDWFFDGNAVVAVGRDLRDERSLAFTSGAEKSRFLRAARAATTPGFGLAFGHRDDDTLTLTLSGPAPWIGALEDLHLEHTLARAEERDGAETATVADSSADATDAEFGVMVFRLRHAWAEDKTLLLGEGSTVLAGIASLLASVSGHSDGGANKNGDNPEGDSDPAASGGEGGRPAEVIIRAEPRLNAVLVRDRLSRREYYEALIRELDRPIRMVQLEAFIFDISRSRLDELGVRWQVSGNDGAASFAPDAAGELRTLSLARDGLRANVSDREGVLLRLQAIEEEGDGEVLSRPSVLTLN
ncbi:MAG: hypothetical protein MPJ52_01185, partial [Alphaproteobacteria bacterium]|nr:hypothetical protein [Alphaproteobacteria bacterium]